MTIQDCHNQYQKLSQHGSGYFEIQLPIIAETERAICFDNSRSDLGKPVPVWIPKSQMKVVEYELAEDFIFSQHSNNRHFAKNWLHPFFI